MDLQTIKHFTDRVLMFDFDSISDIVTELGIQAEVKDDAGNSIRVKGSDLIWIDRIYIYHKIWNATLQSLYQQYLPADKWEHEWNGEITPYTILLCRLADQMGSRKAFLSDMMDQEGRDKDQFIAESKEYFRRINIDIDSFSPALNRCLPSDLLERMDMLYRLLTLMPFRALSGFYHKVHKSYTTALADLGATFGTLQAKVLPEFGVVEPYHRSILYFDHRIYKKFNLDWAEAQPELLHRTDDIKSVRKMVDQMKEKFSGTFVCGCCGTVHETSIPVEALEYKYLLEHNDLAKDMAYLIMPELEEQFKEDIVMRFHEAVEDLNNCNNASVLILVEGDSEFYGLPVLAFKRGFSLKQNGVQVYNSGSKEKLSKDFTQFRKQFKHLKIICLLDSDAKKEKAEMERLMRGHKNKYDLVFLSKGTWEDIFPLPKTVEVLNKLYKEGQSVEISDFDPAKDFLAQINKILWTKKIATFDKVAFSKKICWQLDEEDVPGDIDTILDAVKKFLPVPGNIIKN